MGRFNAFMRSTMFVTARYQKIGVGCSLALTSVGLAFKNKDTLYSTSNHLNSKLKRSEILAEENSVRTTDESLSTNINLKTSHTTISLSPWDNNWDKREPSALVRPLKSNPSKEETEEYGAKIKEMTPTAERTYVLVRHGQYEMKKTDEERVLTKLGRQQANSTGDRLSALWTHFKMAKNEIEPTFDLRFTMSSLTRATETAQIILKHFPGQNGQSCDLIQEGAPCPPVPSISREHWDPRPSDFHEEGARIEAAFRKYIHRADPSQKNDSIDILVCHGNVIRYFVCRALQLPPEAWLRFEVPNASITTITVTQNGRVNVSGLGEAGHLPPEMLTFN